MLDKDKVQSALPFFFFFFLFFGLNRVVVPCPLVAFFFSSHRWDEINDCCDFVHDTI